MATYVVLFDWTEQGVKGYKDSPARVDAAREQMAEVGVQIMDIYWTLGGHDLVGIVEAADSESLAKALLVLGAAGNIRTTTLRAFSQAEFTRLIE
jgi:uncharacterized protein with GYD domain